MTLTDADLAVHSDDSGSDDGGDDVESRSSRSMSARQMLACHGIASILRRQGDGTTISRLVKLALSAALPMDGAASSSAKINAGVIRSPRPKHLTEKSVNAYLYSMLWDRHMNVQHMSNTIYRHLGVDGPPGRTLKFLVSREECTPLPAFALESRTVLKKIQLERHTQPMALYGHGTWGCFEQNAQLADIYQA